MAVPDTVLTKLQNEIDKQVDNIANYEVFSGETHNLYIKYLKGGKTLTNSFVSLIKDAEITNLYNDPSKLAAYKQFVKGRSNSITSKVTNADTAIVPVATAIVNRRLMFVYTYIMFRLHMKQFGDKATDLANIHTALGLAQNLPITGIMEKLRLLQSGSEELQQKVKSLTDDLKTKKAEVDELKELMSQLENVNKDLVKRLQEAQEALDAVTNAWEAKLIEANGAAAKAANAAAKAAANAAATKAAANAAAQAQLASLQTENSDLSGKLQNLETLLKEAKDELVKQKEALEKSFQSKNNDLLTIINYLLAFHNEDEQNLLTHISFDTSSKQGNQGLVPDTKTW